MTSREERDLDIHCSMFYRILLIEDDGNTVSIHPKGTACTTQVLLLSRCWSR